MPAASARRRFDVAAAELGIDIDVQRFPQGTRTAVEAAAAVGCELGQIRPEPRMEINATTMKYTVD